MVKINAISRNTRIHLFLFATSLLLIIVPLLNKTPSQQISEQSIRAAAHFLFLVDTEEYLKSWDVSSQTLKSMLSKEAWNEEITRIRSFLGPIVDRVHHRTSYTDAAADVPEGEYVIMTFISSFELRNRVVETLTLMLGDDDQWQVVGYFLN